MHVHLDMQTRAGGLVLEVLRLSRHGTREADKNQIIKILRSPAEMFVQYLNCKEGLYTKG